MKNNQKVTPDKLHLIANLLNAEFIPDYVSQGTGDEKCMALRIGQRWMNPSFWFRLGKAMEDTGFDLVAIYLFLEEARMIDGYPYAIVFWAETPRMV